MRRLVAPVIAGLLLLVPARVLAHGASASAPRFPGVLFEWRLDPMAVVPLLVVGTAYVWAVRRVNAAHPGNRHPRHRTWLFVAGLVAIGVALTSPIEAYEGLLFSVHMVQHM